MENRTEIRGARVSKGLVVLLAVIVAIGLGVMAAFVAKSFSGPAAATESNLVQSTYSGPGPDAQERNDHARPLQYADDKPSTGHGQLP
jgi:hypothetical protein